MDRLRRLRHWDGWPWNKKEEEDEDISPEEQRFDPRRMEAEKRKLEMRDLAKCTILHYAPLKHLWDWCILFLVVYTAIYTPYDVAFLLGEERRFTNAYAAQGREFIPEAHPLSYFDLAIDVLFISDIVVNFRTTYVDKSKGQVVSNAKKIALHYLRTWFVVDMIAAIPFDFIFIGGHQSSDTTTTTMGLLKTARLLRLVRVVRKMDEYSQYAPTVLILLMGTFVLISHWLACIWYAIGNSELSGEYAEEGWLAKLSDDLNLPMNASDPTMGPSLQSRYLTALYFAMTTVTTVGFGNVSPVTDYEKIFTILGMILGALMYACVFGNVTAIIERLYSGRTKFHQQMNLLTEFIHAHRIPSPLRHRLQEYFKHSWTYSSGIDKSTQEVIMVFPEFLQADISLHLNKNLFKHNQLFKGCSEGCLRALSMKLTATHTAPGDTVLHKKEFLDILYFISRGSMEVVLDEEVQAILEPNDVFGENPLNEQVGRSKSNVRALTYCDLVKITREDIFSVVRLYPEFQDNLLNNLQINYDLRDESTAGNSTTNLFSDLTLEETSFNRNHRPSLLVGNKIENKAVKSPSSKMYRNHKRENSDSSLNGEIGEMELHNMSGRSESVPALSSPRFNITENRTEGLIVDPCRNLNPVVRNANRNANRNTNGTDSVEQRLDYMQDQFEDFRAGLKKNTALLAELVKHMKVKQKQQHHRLQLVPNELTNQHPSPSPVMRETST